MRLTHGYRAGPDRTHPGPNSNIPMLAQESIKADEQRVKMKAKDRREMEEMEERERKAKEEYSRASAGENDAATMVGNSLRFV